MNHPINIHSQWQPDIQNRLCKCDTQQDRLFRYLRLHRIAMEIQKQLHQDGKQGLTVRLLDLTPDPGTQALWVVFSPCLMPVRVLHADPVLTEAYIVAGPETDKDKTQLQSCLPAELRRNWCA